MACILGDATLNMVSLARHIGPKVRKSCDEWLQHGLSLQRYKGWAVSSVICGVGSIESNVSCQISVQDAMSPPSVRTRSYRGAPRTLLYKARRTKRRSRRVGGDGNDDGPGWDEGGFGGSGGWDGSDNGRGGNDHWGPSWNEDAWWWEDARDAAFSFIYEVACWVSLTQCVQFLLSKLLLHDGVDKSTLSGGSFAQCSSVFAETNLAPVQADRRKPELTLPHISS